MSHDKDWLDNGESMRVVADIKQRCCCWCKKKDSCTLLNRADEHIPKGWAVSRDGKKVVYSMCMDME